MDRAGLRATDKFHRAMQHSELCQQPRIHARDHGYSAQQHRLQMKLDLPVDAVELHVFPHPSLLDPAQQQAWGVTQRARMGGCLPARYRLLTGRRVQRKTLRPESLRWRSNACSMRCASDAGDGEG